MQARRPLDLLKDDLAIQAFSLANFTTAWDKQEVAGAYPPGCEESPAFVRDSARCDPGGIYRLFPDETRLSGVRTAHRHLRQNHSNLLPKSFLDKVPV
jgi:hypothetical protein